ncbi:LRR repeats and ubiquitin-like domain-containing protein [Dendrobium catenatum]|uniref:LRR repeats and ubiquitin-like domain-containing protein n=1 Tax=Dendrobium catenatum TaxID=906689 RepID=A0A2I0WBH7_9ASPA|nr:LRR repeats and ubiquitin-like domain-containing protein [Dendrobium catenatum]
MLSTTHQSYERDAWLIQILITTSPTTNKGWFTSFTPLSSTSIRIFDHTIEEYVEHILDTLIEAVEEQLGKIHADVVSLRSVQITDGSKLMMIATLDQHIEDEPSTKDGEDYLSIGGSFTRTQKVAIARAMTISRRKRWKKSGVANWSGRALKALPDDVWDCAPFLIKMEFSSNSIEELPNKIGILKSLNKLYLNDNHLCDEKFSWDGLSQLKSLTVLSLNTNRAPVPLIPLPLSAIMAGCWNRGLHGALMVAVGFLCLAVGTEIPSLDLLCRLGFHCAGTVATFWRFEVPVGISEPLLFWAVWLLILNSQLAFIDGFLWAAVWEDFHGSFHCFQCNFPAEFVLSFGLLFGNLWPSIFLF